MDIQAASLYVSIAALLISTVGWFVVHCSALQIQKLSLTNSLMNEARIALTAAIKELHQSCIDITTSLDALEINERHIPRPESRGRLEIINSIRQAIIDKALFRWAQILEEYECLFPETVEVRVELLSFVNVAFQNVVSWLDNKEHGSALRDGITLERTQSMLMDILALTWDVHIYIQNRVIGRITGHRIEDRQVASSEHPKVICDRTGKLVITNSGGLTWSRPKPV